MGRLEDLVGGLTEVVDGRGRGLALGTEGPAGTTVAAALGAFAAALATVVSEILSAILAGIYFVRRYGAYVPKKEDYRMRMY